MAIYKKGSKGDVVRQIQSALGLIPDGVFGVMTENAVKKFQQENGLIVDGIVGDKTLSAIISDSSSIIKLNGGIEIVPNFLPYDEYISGKYSNNYIILHHTAGWDDPEKEINNWAKDSLRKVGTEFIIGGQRCTDGRSLYDGKIMKAFPDGCQANHIGKSGSSYMNLHSVGIELCNFGYCKKGRTYTGANVISSQMCETPEFRGFTQWHKYSDKQLKSLHELLLYVSKRDNIDLHRGLYEWIKKEGSPKAFDFHQDAYNGSVKGLLTHANIRKDKFDVSPQDELIDMILTL